MTTRWILDPDCCFAPDPAQRHLARQLYGEVKAAPLICPHGHVSPALLADPNASFGTPAELFIIPDHYILRMLYSKGFALEALGIAPLNDITTNRLETDHRQVWQTFAENFYLFRGTPSGLWLGDELVNIFGVEENLNGESAGRIYDYLEKRLTEPAFQPRALFQQFNIAVLCTTDAASDRLEQHKALHREGYSNILPTFRPDGVINLDHPNWQHHLAALTDAVQSDIVDYRSFLQALEEQRSYFKQMGATATDQAALTAYTAPLSRQEAETIFRRALRGEATSDDATRFTGHMFMEMARMSIEDGLVMQMHIGSYRNHNQSLFEQFGVDKGADIPIATEWTRPLRPLLNAYGNNAKLRLLLFGLDEGNYSRELAPLAGHYPAVLLGPPWWFHDSPNGMTRYLEQVVETAGIYNLAGFNDDTRAFLSIPARHDIWRRVSCNWLAGMVLQGRLDEMDALEVAHDLAYRLAKQAYNLKIDK